MSRFPAFLIATFLLLECVLCSPRPLVVWHGLGDSAQSAGMLQFTEEVKAVHPGIFVHNVFISENDDEDKRAGFYGNVNEQIELVSDQLAAIPELKGGFDAIGFSQGGQFLRAYIERYNQPPVNNLITFGSQHMGVSDIAACSPRDFLCQIARRAVKGAVYGTWAQNNLVQAQYFRDPASLEEYLAANHFLPDINNELVETRNETYARNFASLNKLVLVKFSEEKTVVPPESAWFGSQDETSLYDNQRVLRQGLSMREQPLYLEDWIGLRKLDERGDVVFEVCEGAHMQISDCWKGLVQGYIG
ncbi:unnamed protein product [Mycena citricolor]|uniref:Palmitoyl-protein thioesterase 1 n=1 Tax=Mycena citricolor TaxID=2018698 RepID=A0AAD2HS36_9AGAR|nr:unnamed protein product [Mycena citricolor]